MKTSSNFNNFYMEEALKQAKLAFDQDEIPVGAIIVDKITNKIIAKAHNLVEQHKNPLSHAEIVAINQACQSVSTKNLSNCNLYVTLEPCAMCCAAISFTRIAKLFYAAGDPKQGGVEHGVRFFCSKSCFHTPEIYSGLLANPSKNLIKEFFEKIRHHKAKATYL